MRINSLFEHDASMKRQAEQSTNHMPGTIYESSGSGGGGGGGGGDVDIQEVAPSKKAEKGEKGRHRASIACASCRDRRIRVCGNMDLGLGHC